MKGKKAKKWEAQAKADKKQIEALKKQVAQARLDTLRSLLPEYSGTASLSLARLHELIAAAQDEAPTTAEDTAGVRKVTDAPQA